MPERVTIKRVKTPFAVSLRVPGQGQSAQGQSVPKPRPKGVGDGQQVNIPVPPSSRYEHGVTRKVQPAGDWKCRSKPVGGSPGKSGDH